MMSTRWCGVCASVAASGFAVPTFMCLSTRPESTLTISQGRRSAICSARRLLPAAVGPISRMAGGNGVGVGTAIAILPAPRSAAPVWRSLSAHEHLVQIAHAELKPGGSPVIALPRAFGCLHFAQQRVHFGVGEHTMRADRAMAGKRRQQFIATFGEHAAQTELAHFTQHIAREFSLSRVLEQ